MAINKVVFGSDTLIDLSGDTVTADKVAPNATFHASDGILQTGTMTYEAIGAAPADHIHTPASIGAMGTGANNGAVGEEYTITIEPDGGSKGYSSIEVKENATGNEQVQIATQRGFRNVISSWLKLMEGEDSPYVELLHQSSGYNGLNICDSNLNDRINLYYDASNDECGMEIFDADGNDITRQVIGAAPALSTPAGGTVNLTLSDNTEYRFTSAVTSLTLTFPPGNFDCWLKFTTGSSITVTFPAGTKYVGGAPTFEASKTYEMSIKDGSVICAEVTTE